MSLPNKDLDRPLGQSVSPPRAGSRRFSFRARHVLLTAAALAVLGASAVIAMQDHGFRDPAAVAIATPEAGQADASQEVAARKTDAAASETGPKVMRQETKGGPAIIKVEPAEDAEGAPQGAIVIRDPSAVGQDLRVAHLPDRALLEQSEAGPLPTRAADGRRPFDVYARPWSGARGTRIAIVIGGLGLSQTGTQAAIAQLPAEVTLAFSPQGNSLDRWMQTARRKGHELVMQIPMEPFDYPNVDPGRNTLTVAGGSDENSRKLHAALARTTNYTGIMNYMGGRFVADRSAMEPLMEELGQRGLLYLDDGSSVRSAAAELAMSNRVPFAAADTAIDDARDRGSILKKLDELERIARAKGYALGTGSAFDATVEAVSSWVEEAKQRGIEIVPVSAVAADPERG